MNNGSTPTLIEIQRQKKFLLKRPAEVLINNRVYSFFPNDKKTFEVYPGEVTITINQNKHLSLDIEPGEKKELVIKEGLADWKFLLVYGVSAILIVLVVFFLLPDASINLVTGIEILICTIALMRLINIRHNLFYIEEV